MRNQLLFWVNIRFLWVSVFVLGSMGAASAATFTVDNPQDFGATGTTLREALFDANIDPSTADVINFSSSITNSITVYSTLDITGPVRIEGTGQTIGARDKRCDIFELGSGSNGTTITDLAIVDGDRGILFHDSSTGNIITNCRIGVDWSDAVRANNIGIGLAGNFHRIGGNTSAQRNIISGNVTAGIRIVRENTGANPYRNQILGNYIGLNSNGTAAIPNGTGIDVLQSAAALIGGNISTEANIISGNTQYGICFTSASCLGNTISGNIIGLNPAASNAIPNQVDGIRFVSDSSGNFIGMPNTNFHNVIAGNTSSNVRLGTSANFNFIRNNYIGVNSSSTAGFSSTYGIYLEGTTRVLVGGNRNAPLHRNIISGNNASTSAAGICIVNGNSNSILGNYIGTNEAGNSGRPNHDGVRVEGNSTNNNIGGSNAFGITLGNVISGNNNTGSIVGGTQNLIKGNYIGLNATGSAALPNNQYGVYLAGSQHFIGSVVSAAQEQNVISGNTNYGLNVNANNCRIYGNYIGANASGTATLNNGNNNAMMCIGNYNRFEVNSFTDRVGFNNFAMGNTLVSNKIGVLPNGSSSGVSIAQGVLFSSNACGNFIGIDQNNKGNLIANIVGNGVEVNGNEALRNMVSGNTILAVGGKPIGLVAAGNADYPAPTITYAVAGEQVYGTANPGDYIEVFIAENASASGGCTRFLGRATTDGSGHWSVYTPTLTLTDYVCASATSPSHNTSEFSAKAGGVQATHTPTATPTPSLTASRTMTVTPTITPTSDNPLIPYDLKGKTTIAFPNPGKQKISFLFHFYQDSKVRIDIFNINGERVAVLTEKFTLGQGQTLVWDCKNVAMGIYFACVHIDGVEKQRVRLAVIH